MTNITAQDLMREALDISETVTVTLAPPAPAAAISEGVWTVGVDIAPGVYRTIAPVGGRCYWATLKTGSNSRREAAIRMGDRLLVMSDGTDDEGQPCPGYAWTAGALLDGEYVDETGAQWADTEAEARAAIAEWVAAI